MSENPLDVDPLDVTNLNREGAYQYLRSLGFPVTRWLMKNAFERKKVRPARLGNGDYVSRRDMLNWIDSRRQDGPYRVSSSGAAVSNS